VGVQDVRFPSKPDVLTNENFTLFRTTPIFYEHDETVDGPIASATFFEIENRIFLITARHIFDDFRPERFLIPYAPRREKLIDLAEYEIIRPNQSEYDVCALEIVDYRKKTELRRNGWQFLSLANITTPSADGLFLLFGYPYAIRNEGRVLETYNPLSAYARRLSAPPEASDRLPGNLDLFFEYGPIGGAPDGSDVKAPDLPGASGCSIWSLPSNSTLWMPPRVVGVQVSFFRNKYFRAIDWRVVAKLLGMADPQLEASIQRHFELSGEH
jgi:hypothetical protein